MKEIDIPERVGNSWRAIVMRTDVVNGNKRIYSRKVIESNLDRLLTAINGRSLIGELGSHMDSIIHFKDASHFVTDIRLKEDYLECNIETLGTSNGMLLKELLESSPELIRFRPRGIGGIGRVDENGILLVGDSYKLITIDAHYAGEAAALQM